MCIHVSNALNSVLLITVLFFAEALAFSKLRSSEMFYKTPTISKYLMPGRISCGSLLLLVLAVRIYTLVQLLC